MKKAFLITFGDKLLNEGYCDLSKFINGKRYKDELFYTMLNIHSPLANIFKEPYANELTIDQVWSQYVSNYLLDYDEEQMGLQEAEALVYWYYQAFKGKSNRENATMSHLIEYFSTQLTYPQTIKYTRGILYDSASVDINYIVSIGQFTRQLSFFNDNNKVVFYRGHSAINHTLSPSIMRKEGWRKNESKMYNELRIACPDDFIHDNTHLEILTRMQHYGLPTRLLDITKNPLVALYFSCCDSTNELGEFVIFAVETTNVKFPNSDTAALLSSLPLFCKEDQERLCNLAKSKASKLTFNSESVVRRLLHEVQVEKPGFSDEIEPSDLTKSIVVLPLKSNKRIAKQDGAFILCGLANDYKDLNINDLRYKINGKKQIYVVANKSKILEQLDQISINEANLFPEIDDVAQYIKRKNG